MAGFSFQEKGSQNANSVDEQTYKYIARAAPQKQLKTDILDALSHSR
jgi:hypothetical protein